MASRSDVGRLFAILISFANNLPTSDLYTCINLNGKRTEMNLSVEEKKKEEGQDGSLMNGEGYAKDIS